MYGLYSWTVYLLGHMIHLDRVVTAPAGPCSSIRTADHMLHLHQQLLVDHCCWTLLHLLYGIGPGAHGSWPRLLNTSRDTG